MLPLLKRQGQRWKQKLHRQVLKQYQWMIRIQEKKAKIQDAVIAVLVCREEVFAIQRQPFLEAFPGYHSFPGGKVDEGESESVAQKVARAMCSAGEEYLTTVPVKVESQIAAEWTK